MTTERAQRAEAPERLAYEVEVADLVQANTAALGAVADVVEQRDDVDAAVLAAIRDVGLKGWIGGITHRIPTAVAHPSRVGALRA